MSSPTPREKQGQVLPFRPRRMPRRPQDARPPVPDLQRFERAPEDADDFRHRMMMNGLCLLVIGVLIAGGLWIADVMAHMRRDQDCVLTGRANCMPIEVPRDR